MKSPWQLGLLGVAVIGVSAYDYAYFADRSQKPVPVVIATEQTDAAIAEPLLAPLPEIVTPEIMDNAAGSDLQPAISSAALQLLSRKPFISQGYMDAASNGAWPRRDPFTGSITPRSRAGRTAATILSPGPPARKPQSPPRCVFSGTMLGGADRLALVDGTPLSVGDRLGDWQLVQIESDFIIFESEQDHHRIQLSGFTLETAHREDFL